jgi:hypothetical protein
MIVPSDASSRRAVILFAFTTNRLGIGGSLMIVATSPRAMPRLAGLASFVVLGMLSACASLDVSSDYKPPEHPTVPSSITVNKPFDDAWNDFVRNLATSFFTVNTISKESRLINISLNQGGNNNFIDCGTVTYKINSKDWTFNPARNATFREGGFRSETVVEHEVTGRRGRMNIFVAPKGSATVFEINTTYGIDMKQKGRAVVRNLFGDVVSSDYLPTSEASFRFTTKVPDRQPLSGVEITCQASGEWEQLILDLARPG